MEIRPLGTGAALPSRTRHVAALALVRDDTSWLLFDAGDGAQYRILEAGLKLRRLEAVFVSHLHGDHIFGVPGILGTASMLGRVEPLILCGPAGLEEFVKTSMRVSGSHLSFELSFINIETNQDGRCHLRHGESVEWKRLDHSLPCWGYRWNEAPKAGSLDVEKIRALGLEPGPLYGELKKGHDVALLSGQIIHSSEVRSPALPGRSFAYCTDTRPCDSAIELARKAELLVFESTYGSEHSDLALERGHSTAVEAAQIAREAGAHELVLTHFSSRYTHTRDVVEQARQVFANTHAAEDLSRYVIERPLLSADEPPEQSSQSTGIRRNEMPKSPDTDQVMSEAELKAFNGATDNDSTGGAVDLPNETPMGEATLRASRGPEEALMNHTDEGEDEADDDEARITQEEVEDAFS